MKKLRIFLADDHAVVREGLKLLLETHPELEVVGEAGDDQSAIEEIAKCQPDIAIVDLSMPRKSGLELTNELRHNGHDIKILILTMHENPALATDLLNAGARGYVVKKVHGDELINAIQTVARGEIYVDPSLT